MKICAFEYWEEDPCHWEYLASFIGTPSKEQLCSNLIWGTKELSDLQYAEMLDGDSTTVIDSYGGTSEYRLTVISPEQGEA